MTERATLERWFRDAGSVLLGYSGGVDSGLLAVVGAASLGPARFLAVIGRSGSLPEAQRASAVELAARFGVPVAEIATAELDDPGYRANAPDRCYHCKSELWRRLVPMAAARGFAVVIDGTNRDDLGEHRPGARAGLERSIRSPFVELGWGKDTVRAVARAAGLPNWAAPAAPCLASRIRYGLAVTEERLRQVEAAEAVLRELGVRGNLRVRHHGDRARVEVDPEMLGTLESHWAAVERALHALGFVAVERDPAGYRRGSLLPVAS